MPGGVYVNPYFGLRYPLPAGWKTGPLPPPPSHAGYYVLGTPAPPPDTTATILVAAQDEIFAAKSTATAQRLVQGLARRFSDPGGPAPASESVTMAGHEFIRLGIPPAPQSRIVQATEIRCHVLIFTFTSAGPRVVDIPMRIVIGADGKVQHARPRDPRRPGAAPQH